MFIVIFIWFENKRIQFKLMVVLHLLVEVVLFFKCVGYSRHTILQLKKNKNKRSNGLQEIVSRHEIPG